MVCSITSALLSARASVRTAVQSPCQVLADYLHQIKRLHPADLARDQRRAEPQDHQVDGGLLPAVGKNVPATLGAGGTGVDQGVTGLRCEQLPRLGGLVEVKRTAAARVMRPTPRGSHNSTTVQHKDREPEELADQIAAFKRAGGKVEILGNTPARREMSRREVNDASGSQRLALAAAQRGHP